MQTEQIQATAAFLSTHSYDWYVGDDGIPRVLIDVREPDGSYTTEIEQVRSVAEARDVLGY